jgi:hypothetical protein
MVKNFGIGNFLGGMAQGYQQMAKIQQDKERLMLEAEALKLREKGIVQDAEQFADYQTLQRERMKMDYGMHMEDVRFREREAWRASKLSPKDSVMVSYMLTDVVPKLSPEQGNMLRGIFEPMLRQTQPPQDTLGGTATEGISGFHQFYKGGILTGLGQ